MEWIYDGIIFDKPSDHDYGFVYQITNLTNNKAYIGKKLFWFKKIKTLKGKRKRYLAESDWRTYYGSSKFLQEEIEKMHEVAQKTKVDVSSAVKELEKKLKETKNKV
jgi:hypothetical protein